jgi:ATPase subunit of ABC transporter with duplicated ATPase domains
MSGLNKSYGAKKVLDNIHLQFYPDAKIGVLGPNGAGKSTLLRSWPGSTRSSPARPGWPRARPADTCRRSRSSTPTRTCAATSWMGVAEKQAILDRYNELMMNYSDENADEGAKLQDIIDSQNLWDLDSQVEQAMDALRCPPAMRRVSTICRAVSAPRGAASCFCRKPDLILLDEPTNHLDAESRRVA